MTKLRSLIDRYLRPIIKQMVIQEIMNQPKIFGDPSKLTISSKAKVNNAFFNCNSGTIIIEDYVGIAHNAMIITGSHDFNVFNAEREESILNNRNITIEQGVFIGSGAIILGPCRIGRHTVIGAGAVVTKDIPEFSVVTGNPARVLKGIKPN